MGNHIIQDNVDAMHCTDHIRDWLRYQVGCKTKPAYKLCENVCTINTLIGFYDGRNTGINTVETLLNRLGYTLVIEPIGKRGENDKDK